MGEIDKQAKEATKNLLEVEKTTIVKYVLGQKIFQQKENNKIDIKSSLYFVFFAVGLKDRLVRSLFIQCQKKKSLYLQHIQTVIHYFDNNCFFCFHYDIQPL